MKIVIFTDLHVFPHRFGSSVSPATGRHSRLQNCLDVLDQTSRMALDVNATYRMFLGDMFHVRGRLAPSYFNPVYEHYRREHQSLHVGYKDILLVGNHDMESRTGGETAINSLKMDDVYVLEDHGLTVISNVHTGEVIELGYVQYNPSVTKTREMIKSVSAQRRLSTRKAKGIFIIHHGIDGVMPGIPDCGLAPTDLPTDEFDWCFCGDYHMHKEIIPNKAWMVGAPLQHNFGDAYQERGYIVLDTDADSVEFIPNEIAPKFFTLDNVSALPVPKSNVFGNFFRIRDERQDKIDEYAKALREYGAAGIQTELVKDWKAVEKSSIEMSMTTEQMFKAWLKDQELGKLDKEQIEKKNREVLDEAGIA